MEIKLLKNHSSPDLLVRVLSPMGRYPAKSILTHKSAYIADQDISFTIIKYEKFELDPKNYYSEMDWAHPEEIRLFASLLLPIYRHGGRTTIYPFPESERISVSGPINFESQYLLNSIKAFLIDTIDARDKKVTGYARSIILPPVNNGPKYDFSKKVINYELQTKVYSAIDKNDYLLIRGLSTLIKSIMLSCHYLFIEEAIYTLFIAMEVSFRIVLRTLKNQGNKNPSSADAMNYILDAFDEPQIYISYGPDKIRHLKNYFEEFYESRIKSVHPESRFGIFPYAPLQVDDFYYLKNSLLEVFTYLLTGFAPTNK